MKRRIAAVVLALMLVVSPGVQGYYQVLWDCTEFFWFFGWREQGHFQQWTGGEPPYESGWMNFPYAWTCYPIMTCWIGEGGTCGGMG